MTATPSSGTPSSGRVDPDDPAATRFDLVREGARRDGVEIVHYEPRIAAGSKNEKRVERTIAFLLLMTGAMATAFLVIYIWWPWEYDEGTNLSKLYTPLLGLTLALTLAGVGLAVVTWAKKLLPHEVAVEKRHVGGSPPDERKLTGAALVSVVDETGITRRPMLKGALVLGLLPVGAVAVVPLVGGLIERPTKVNPLTGKAPLFYTGFDPALNGGKPIRLIRLDKTPVRPEEISPGGVETVFPGIPGGTTNEWADSPTLLFHLREEDADAAHANLPKEQINVGSMFGNFVAYSKICTHAGCPASLYEQQTHKLLCPCHQSQFNVTDNARPIFGPATRPLPMLPLGIDDEGFFIATSDYKVPIGPGFWERP
jgi:ubiquinol-cytochrome c reductase iron-sulfur subunit